LRTFCDAYGLERWDGILDVMVRRIEVMVATGVAAHNAGDPVHGDQWLQVMKPRLLRDMNYIRGL
jgi:hypothetical protein